MSRARQLNREINSVLSRRKIGYRVSRHAQRKPERHHLVFHPIGSEGDPWPTWLHAYKKACGVYVIKEGSKVVYVGSSKARLYDTVTRHFQQWKRHKNWWKGQYGAHHDPGLTYQRGRCQVAVKIVPCGQELTEEARLIDRLRPRDNITAHPDGGGDEEIPF